MSSHRFKYKPFDNNAPTWMFADGMLGNNDFAIQVQRILMAYDPYKWFATQIIRYRFLVIPINKTVKDIVPAQIKWVSPEGVEFDVSNAVGPSPSWKCIDWGGPHKNQTVGCSAQLDYPMVPYLDHHLKQTHATILVA